jgi:hypothetical protein
VSIIILLVLYTVKSHDISALGYGLDDRCSRFRFSAGVGNFSLHHRVQNGSGAHPASYPMGTRASFPEVKEYVELYLHSPNTPSWLGAQLKKSTGSTLLFYFYFAV